MKSPRHAEHFDRENARDDFDSEVAGDRQAALWNGISDKQAEIRHLAKHIATGSNQPIPQIRAQAELAEVVIELRALQDDIVNDPDGLAEVRESIRQADKILKPTGYYCPECGLPCGERGCDIHGEVTPTYQVSEITCDLCERDLLVPYAPAFDAADESTPGVLCRGCTPARHRDDCVAVAAGGA